MRRTFALLLLAVLVTIGAAGCSSQGATTTDTQGTAEQDSATDALDSQDTPPAGDESDTEGEPVSREAEEETQERAAATSWSEPDPVALSVDTVASGSGMDASDISGMVGARENRGDSSWVRVDISHSDPSYEGELVYLTIIVGDAEWTIIDFGTGLTASDLEDQGVPSDVAIGINPY